jgi:hypothetical protein
VGFETIGRGVRLVKAERERERERERGVVCMEASIVVLSGTESCGGD